MLVSIVADRRLRLLGQLLPTLFLLLLLAGGSSALAAETRQQSCGGSIQYGDSEQHYNHADWPHCDYWFQGDEGDRVTVHVQVQRGGLRPQLLLGDSNGRIIAQTTGTALSHVLNAGDGEYVLRLTSADNPRNYGFFTIWLQEPVAQKYRELGGSNSFLGAPSITERSTPDGAGRFRHYAGGSIYFHPTTGAHEVHGAIRNRWSTLRWEQGFLGYPVSDETRAADGAGRYSHFQGGSIYWHPRTGAWEVHGGIRAKWIELGGERSFLGYPVSNEEDTPDQEGRVSFFQGGAIYWLRGRGAVVEGQSVRSSQSSPSTNMGAPRFVTAPDYPTPRPTPTPCTTQFCSQGQALTNAAVIEYFDVLLCGDAARQACAAQAGGARLFRPGDEICVAWLETGDAASGITILLNRGGQLVADLLLEGYGNKACRSAPVNSQIGGNYQTIIRWGTQSSLSRNWAIATPTPTRTPTRVPTATPTRDSSSGSSSGSSSLKQTLLNRVASAEVGTGYPAQAGQLVDALVAIVDLYNRPGLGVSSAEMVNALRQFDVGNRINGTVQNIWDGWQGTVPSSTLYSADPGSYGLSPFRQLIVRLIQGRQGGFSNAELLALYSLLTRQESTQTWVEDVNGVVGAINREYLR